MLLDLGNLRPSGIPVRHVFPLLQLLLTLVATQEEGGKRVGQLRLAGGAGPHEGNIQEEGGKRVGQLRLAGGAGPHEGNIQVEVDGVWGFVCDDDFGFREADVVCRDVGYERAETFTRNNHFGNNSPEWRRRSVRFWLDRVNCSVADTFSACSSSGLGVHDCGSTEVAGVVCVTGEARCGAEEVWCGASCVQREAVCNGVRDCPNNRDEREELCSDVGVVRLSSNTDTNIPAAAYGTVFVKYQQEWSTICGAGFSTDDAKVICRSLGYGSGWVVPFSLSYFGVGTGPVHVHKMECRGYEDWIRECPSFVWSQSLCVHHLDVGVFCYDGGLELRLAGGSNPDTGVVEAKMGNVWGSFCDADFDDFDAQVVCRQLGYVDGISASRLAARPTPGPMWHIRLDCLGQEHTLQECRIRFLNGTCSRSSAASVRCFNTAGFVDDALKALLPADCGVLEEASDQFIIRLAKIRGGSHPTRFNSPWLASLRSRKGHLGCGAFIISEDYLITAAHCFNRGGVLNFKVRVGDHNENFREEFEEEFDIEKIWIHENLNAYTFLDNDIALIKIKREYGRGITFGPRVKPVCLPSSSDSYEDLGDCIIMGWGRVEEEGQTQPRPNEVEIGIIPDYVCESRFLGGAHNYSSSSVCFGGIRTKGEACNGDSGGPLTCSTSGRHTAYGVFSRGLVCGKVPAPSVGVRMTKFLRWILEKIRN